MDKLDYKWTSNDIEETFDNVDDAISYFKIHKDIGVNKWILLGLMARKELN